MRKFMFVVLCVLSAGNASSVYGGSGTVSGRKPGTWDEGRYSLIAARVKEVRVISEPDEGTHEVKLEPLATLAGHFDPSESAALLVRFYAQQPETSSIADAPHAGSFVLALIMPGHIAGDATRPCVFVESMWCKFMPGESGLVVIDGLGDKRVMETLARIRDARAHPHK